MRSISALILFLLTFNLSSSQHTKRFEKIVLDQSPSNTEIVDVKFKNHKQKKIGRQSIYELDKYVYTFRIGKWTEYYKSGQILIEANYDNFGNAIVWKMYDGKGNLLRESKTIEIDSDAKDFAQFLDDKKTLAILTYEKNYKYTYKACKWFLASEGKMLNYKKIGEWKKYYDDGKVKKVIEY